MAIKDFFFYRPPSHVLIIYFFSLAHQLNESREGEDIGGNFLSLIFNMLTIININ